MPGAGPPGNFDNKRTAVYVRTPKDPLAEAPKTRQESPDAQVEVGAVGTGQSDHLEIPSRAPGGMRNQICQAPFYPGGTAGSAERTESVSAAQPDCDIVAAVSAVEGAPGMMKIITMLHNSQLGGNLDIYSGTYK
ncbi:MAG: hypothetical protein V3W44_10530 [Dehalococcoidales bacterium]